MPTRHGARVVQGECGWTLIGVATAAVAGVSAANGLAPYAAIAAVAGGTLFLVTVRIPAVLSAALLLVALNGIPGVNLANLSFPAGLKTDDICAGIFIGASAIRLLSRAAPAKGWLQTFAICWSAALALFWFFTFARTVDAGESAKQAFNFGRDFLIFAIATPLAVGVFRDRREIAALGAILAIATAVYSVIYVAAAVGILPSALANPTRQIDAGSLTRVFTLMNRLIGAVFFFSLAYAATRQGRWARIMTGVAAVTGVALILGLTRAVYLCTAIALVAVTAAWIARGGAVVARFRRRLLIGLVAILATGGLTVAIVPGVWSSSAASTLNSRLTQTVTSLSGGDGAAASTVTYRTNLAHTMLEQLGPHWPLGLGFQAPSYRYYADLPLGSIRNSDLGFFNQLMTMGLVGTILFYLPFVALALAAMLAAQFDLHDEMTWYWMGALAWSVFVLASMPTLGIVNTPWALLAALIFGAGVRAFGSEGDARTRQVETTSPRS